MTSPRLRLTTLALRPELLDVVADWVWQAFWRGDGSTFQETREAYAKCTVFGDIPQTFILLEDGAPVGTSTLAPYDLAERPDLTPWLAGVFVVPERRGRGYVQHLLGSFDAACRAAAIDAAWLYTSTAEPIYARAGWQAVERIARPGKPTVTLMQRHFAALVTA